MNQAYIKLRKDIISLIEGENLKVLDVGCSNGINGKWLLDQGMATEVIGVETHEESVKNAKQNITKVIEKSIEDQELLESLKGEDFDYIILGDVLEHLIDPWHVLSELEKSLKSTGKMIISLPNVQHLETIKHLVFKGKFPYEPSGLYDKTHMRWFTLKNIEDLVDQANMHIEKLTRVERYSAYKGGFPLIPRILRKLGLFKNFFTFQYVFRCVKK
ncbi:methionine biosynthesis protein MetW [Kordia periserrulae]|uniref:Methionine biosynthesis protein MetW n=1 Tax=Kordia periserrulae TaxID=701523 RepID=A0A2T6BZK7_9FLAO|nr:class I SAM-dependent methyltransferase [Kordia periserrulae]PTX61500.1 methionine biosynthesis protein MetW [Kordia periserrulae]